MKNSTGRKARPEPYGFMSELCQICKKELVSSLNFLQKLEEQKLLPKSFYDANITLITKLKKPQKRKLSPNVPDETIYMHKYSIKY